MTCRIKWQNFFIRQVVLLLFFIAQIDIIFCYQLLEFSSTLLRRTLVLQQKIGLFILFNCKTHLRVLGSSCVKSFLSSVGTSFSK